MIGVLVGFIVLAVLIGIGQTGGAVNWGTAGKARKVLKEGCMTDEEREFHYGLVETALGIIGVVYSLITINSDMNSLLNYKYKSPLSNHELIIIAVLMISITAAIVGGIMLRFLKVSREDEKL